MLKSIVRRTSIHTIVICLLVHDIVTGLSLLIIVPVQALTHVHYLTRGVWVVIVIGEEFVVLEQVVIVMICRRLLLLLHHLLPRQRLRLIHFTHHRPRPVKHISS